MAAATLTPAKAESTPMSENPTQALEKASDRTPAVITTPEEYRGALLRWQEQRFNVLTPFTNISGMAAQHGIITSLIQVNPDKAIGEVYDGLPFLKDNEVSLAKIGLRKLAECAGISTRTDGNDDRRIPFYWEFKAIASYRGIDGSIITREATKEWDLRDGSPQLKGWTNAQIEEGRKHGLRNCEARAINAAIRECGCGVKQMYTRDELKKPFVVCRVMFQPDMSDPDIKRLVTAAALGGTTALYPSAAREAQPGEIIDHGAPATGDPRPVGSSSTPQASQPKPAEPDPDRPPCDGAVRIVSVEDKTFTYKSGPNKGKEGLRYVIVDSLGVEHSTFDEGHAKDARRFKAEHAWVEIAEEVDGQYKNLIEITRAGQQPSLPEMGKL